MTTSETSVTAPPIDLREIDVNVTNFCNLSCVYCSYASRPDRSEPSLDGSVVHRIIDEARELGCRVVHFSGGEPVLRDDIGGLIAHASQLGPRTRLLSNGVHLTPEKLDELWRSGLRRVLVSLDGLATEHDYHRQQRGLFEKTVRGIRNAVAAGYDVRVNSVVTTRNVHQIPRLLSMLGEMGVATFTSFYCIPVGRGRQCTSLMVPPVRWREFIEELREEAAGCAFGGMEVTVEKVFQWLEEPEDAVLLEGRGGSCLGFLHKCDYLNILADGRVYPCVCFIDEGPALGNVHEQPLADIVHAAEGWRFYRSLEQAPAACRGCAKRARCRGGSRAMSRAMLGEWFGLDPRCTGDVTAQGFFPLCVMQREDIQTGTVEGFAEHVVG